MGPLVVDCCVMLGWALYSLGFCFFLTAKLHGAGGQGS